MDELFWKTLMALVEALRAVLDFYRNSTWYQAAMFTGLIWMVLHYLASR